MNLMRVRSLVLRNPTTAAAIKLNQQVTAPVLENLVARSNVQTLHIPKRWNTQHRVILLPEVPDDSAKTNPILNTPQLELPQLSEVTESNCYYGLGKALLIYESAICRMEDSIKAGAEDWSALLENLEHSRVLLESAWNTVNLLNIVSDKLDIDRFTTLNKRAERAFLSRYDSKTIFEFLSSDKVNNVSGEEKTLLDRFKLEYKHQGFGLPEKKYLELNANWVKRLYEAQRDHRFKITTTTQRFRHVIRDPVVVREFPVDLLRAMAADSSQPAKGPWSVTLHPYIHRKFLEYCPDRRIRWNAHVAYVNRGSREMDVYMNASGQVKDIRQHRLDQAVTLGYKNYAEMSMATKMAGSVDKVLAMISTMHSRAKTAQEIELASLQDYAETRGFEDSIREFDVEFFKRKQIRTLYGIEDEAMRDYFPLPHVLKTVFKLLEDHYNLVFTYTETKGEDKPWEEEVSVYKVTDKQGNLKGHCYLDPYIRDDKGYQGGDRGWYIPLRANSSVAGTTPVGCVVMALGPPGYGKPSLLSFNEVEELLRQMGKAVVHLSANRKWVETSGRTGVEWDALNMVPNLLTHWISVPQVLQSLSCHWSTGEQLSPLMAENQIAAKKHMAGYALSHELFKAVYDISFYSTEFEQEQYQALEQRLTPQYLVLSREKEDCFPLYFEDIMTGNWAAGYYSHLWSRMLAADLFSAYWEAGWDNKEAVAKVSDRIADLISAGSSRTCADLFREFRGRDPNPEALMLSLGLSGSRAPKMRTSSE